MSESESETRNAMLPQAAVALLQGATLWWLYRSIEQHSWPATDRGWLIGLITTVILVPIAHYLLSGITSDRRRFWVLPPLALALFGFGWHDGAWTASENNFETIPFALAIIVLVFHALPFLQSWLAHRRLRPRYEDLFHYAWRNTLLVAFGAIFCGVFWILLWLWAVLFRMLDVSVFIDLFTKPYFSIPATTVALAIGMQLAGSVERLQNALRNQLLTLLKWLTPLAALILALFTLTLLVKSPALLLEQRRVISATWLLWLVAMTVALLNSAYQDGRTEAPYPSWLGKSIRLIVPLLLPVSLIATYAIVVRVDSYGLTVARTWGILVAVIAMAYAAGYAWAALRRDSWMGSMGVVNVGVALATVLLLTLMLTPVLSPERLAAASQYARVLEQQDPDSYRYLRFDSGDYGRTRLQSLAELQGHPHAGEIRAAAKLELERKAPWSPQEAETELAAGDFEVFPAGQVLDPGMLSALNASHQNTFQACEPADPCPVLFADLNRDGDPEALVFSGYGTLALRKLGGQWTVMERMQQLGASASFNDAPKIRERLAKGDYVVRDLGWQVLEIQGELYVFDDAVEQPRSKLTPPPD